MSTEPGKLPPQWHLGKATYPRLCEPHKWGIMGKKKKNKQKKTLSWVGREMDGRGGMNIIKPCYTKFSKI